MCPKMCSYFGRQLQYGSTPHADMYCSCRTVSTAKFIIVHVLADALTIMFLMAEKASEAPKMSTYTVSCGSFSWFRTWSVPRAYLQASQKPTAFVMTSWERGTTDVTHATYTIHDMQPKVLYLCMHRVLVRCIDFCITCCRCTAVHRM